jgi:serine protease Do
MPAGGLKLVSVSVITDRPSAILYSNRPEWPFAMRFRLIALAGAVLWASVALADPVSKSIPVPPAVVAKPQPESVDDLKAFQKQVREVIDKVIPTTVCLQVGGATGSGVLVSEDGLIMTAGHVSGEPGKPITVTLHDGTKHEGTTLGFNPGVDSGMVKINAKGKWPYAEVAPSKDLKANQWVITTGHPGGMKKARAEVVRVGRIGEPKFSPPEGGVFLQTDCTLVGGDSGGPLFDMQGRVIGIHSRIGGPIAQNLHVPSDRYKDAWDALVKGEVLGVSPYLGVSMEEAAKDCKLGAITRGAPAAIAGLKVGDVITKLAGKDVASYDEMVKVLKAQKPLSEVTVEVKRGDEVKEFKVKIGYRPD